MPFSKLKKMKARIRRLSAGLETQRKKIEIKKPAYQHCHETFGGTLLIDPPPSKGSATLGWGLQR